jgi:tetratricopeptide (TPR) repeat protein
MSGRKTRARRPARGARQARGRRARPWWLLPLVGLVLLGFLSLRVWPKRRPVEAGLHPAVRLSAEEAYKTGLTLGGEGHHLEALPYYASAVRQAPDSWTVRQSYSSALHNSALETRLHLGKAEPVTRSSVERIAMVNVSMRESRIADSLAQQPADHAVIAFQRGQALHSFGLVDDALVEFRRAEALYPSSPVIAAAVRDAERRLASGGPGE